MMAEQKENVMEYRVLGNTGLKISVLGMGTMTFTDVKIAKEIISASRKFGINFFDNAELYGQKPGDEETIFGKALKELQQEDPELYRRSELVITTKLFFGGAGNNEKGLNRKHVIEGMNNSLKRLQLDYVDVVFALRYDPTTPMLEVVEGFTNIINSGKALYWATSEWPAIKICEAYWVARLHNLIPPIADQAQYSMLVRDVIEKDMMELYGEPYKYGLTTWSPLYGGFLTGKYLNPDKEKEGRNNLGPFLNKSWKDRFENLKEEDMDKLKKLIEYAKNELKTDITTLALAWVIKNHNVSTMLLGASNISQLENNVKCLDLARKITQKNLNDIDGILKNKPLFNNDTFYLKPKKTF